MDPYMQLLRVDLDLGPEISQKSLLFRSKGTQKLIQFSSLSAVLQSKKQRPGEKRLALVPVVEDVSSFHAT